MTEREKLEREIYTLGQIVGSNAATLNSKTMSNDDRAALQRQMTTRISHLKLLQKRLERLSKEARRQLAQAGHGPASLSRADLGM